MAKQALGFLVLSLVVFSVVFVVPSNGRPLSEKGNDVDGEIEKVLEELYLKGMKTGGPSHGGDGHALTLGGIKKSGPSPGAGN